MSAAELRQAAETLRQRAEAATQGMWGIGNGSDIASEVEQRSRGSFSYQHMIARLDDSDYDEAYAEPRDNGATEEDDAAYIVTMQPNVGLALADFIEMEHDLHIDDEMNGTDDGPLCDSWPHALKLARLINGGAA